MRIRFEGLDNYIEKMEKLADKSVQLGKSTLYEGARVMADNTKKALQSIPIDTYDGVHAPYIPAESNRKLTGVTPQQKQDIINGFGISHMRVEGDVISVKLGFDGYTVNGKGEGSVPIAMLLRAHESGTSFVKKAPIVRRAFASGRKESIAAMENHVSKVIKETFG